MSSRGPALNLDVLVIDDDKRLRNTIKVCLQALGCRVEEAANAPAARAALERRTFELVFVDLRLGPDNGLDLVPALAARNPTAEIVVITGFATIESAVQATKLGAHSYLPKPFAAEQIQHLAQGAAARRALAGQIHALRAGLGSARPEIDLQTGSPRMRQVIEMVTRLAAHEGPVLFRGERGTGKRVLARRLHALSSRSVGPFLVLDCAGTGEEALAGELFGLAEGAFAHEEHGRPGSIEAAAGGTLLIEEIAELPPRLQSKLARLLLDNEFERVGETKPRRAEARIIAVSNRDLDKEAAAGRFRKDLLERLKILEISVPPLRERREDILRMAHRFLAFYSRGGPIKSPELTLEAETALKSYHWPGNIIELCQAMERAAALRVGTRIGVESLPESVVAHSGRTPYLGGEFSLDAIEREHILRVLASASTQEEASRILGIDASTLWRKRKRYEI